MRLEFKLPKGKLPFLGVVFDSEYWAAVSNEELIDKYKGCRLEADIEPLQNDRINLILYNEEFKIKCYYSNQHYDYKSFVKWLRVVNKSEVNFSHLFIEDGQHKVVRTATYKQLFVLRIKAIKLIGTKLSYSSKWEEFI